MKDFQLLSGRIESEVKSKLRTMQKQGWRIALGNSGHEEGAVCWKDSQGMKYYLGVVK